MINVYLILIDLLLLLRQLRQPRLTLYLSRARSPGRSQPRYQLFGREVDAVAKMESSSVPDAIHCSLPFAEVLVAVGGFSVVGRSDKGAFIEVPSVYTQLPRPLERVSTGPTTTGT